ncbi:MAG: ligase-associated DNA damage response endonuclease PdeM [Saprospiraceae bacterium]|nr:ligase-associated DNA damage response endonuclease PdeM [Saprospiraceae bacterium]
MNVEVAGEELVLHHHKAVYWPDRQALILADLHLGKIDHFRNSGLYVPAIAAMDNYERMSSLMLDFEVKRLIVVGDLFHSTLNADWKNFATFRTTFASVDFDLVIGNHDILDVALWEKNNVSVYQSLTVGPFSFSHYEEEIFGTYNLSGHVHPGVRLIGSPGHSLTLPCFHFGKSSGILPAFGTFTGLSVLSPQRDDQVIVIGDEELICF